MGLIMDFNVLVLSGLISNNRYLKRVFPHLKKEYFSDFETGYVFSLIKKYINKYKNLPTKTTLIIELHNQNDISEEALNNIEELIKIIYNLEFDHDVVAFIDQTEEWCKKRALHNSILKSVEMLESGKNFDSIPDMIRKALQVQFQLDGGQELLNDKDIDKRWDAYHEKITKYSTGIDKLDKATGGGFEHKSVTVIMAATNVGKSMSMVSIASNMIRDGHNVLYVTFEMAEEKMAQRFEANILDVDINDVPLMNQKKYKSGLCDLKNKGCGRLIIKEFPTASANKNHIAALLDELELKRDFRPKIVFLDYLNIMTSCRFSGENMYSIIKSIVEEIRGLSVEKELCIVTATQGNRATNNSKNSDMELSDISESIATAQTADCVIGLIAPQDLLEQGIQVWKIMKNRFGGVLNYKFPVKVIPARCQVFDCDQDIKLQGNGDNEGKMKEEGIRIQKKNKISFEGKKEFLNELEEFIDE